MTTSLSAILSSTSLPSFTSSFSSGVLRSFSAPAVVEDSYQTYGLHGWKQGDKLAGLSLAHKQEYLKQLFQRWVEEGGVTDFSQGYKAVGLHAVGSGVRQLKTELLRQKLRAVQVREDVAVINDCLEKLEKGFFVDFIKFYCSMEVALDTTAFKHREKEWSSSLTTYAERARQGFVCFLHSFYTLSNHREVTLPYQIEIGLVLLLIFNEAPQEFAKLLSTPVPFKISLQSKREEKQFIEFMEEQNYFCTLLTHFLSESFPQKLHYHREKWKRLSKSIEVSQLDETMFSFTSIRTKKKTVSCSPINAEEEKYSRLFSAIQLTDTQQSVSSRRNKKKVRAQRADDKALLRKDWESWHTYLEELEGQWVKIETAVKNVQNSWNNEKKLLCSLADLEANPQLLPSQLIEELKAAGRSNCWRMFFSSSFPHPSSSSLTHDVVPSPLDISHCLRNHQRLSTFLHEELIPYFYKRFHQHRSYDHPTGFPLT